MLQGMVEAQSGGVLVEDLESEGGPKGMETKDVIALIAYMQRLGHDIQLSNQTGGKL